jgi:hypothetical protein
MNNNKYQFINLLYMTIYNKITKMLIVFSRKINIKIQIIFNKVKVNRFVK